jgi:ATPase subunit of ABC transporter with duplicated ATPase domains
VLTSYSGNYDFYEKQRAVNEATAEAAYERQQAMLAKEMRFIERFKAQAAKAAQVQSRVKKLDKIEKVEPPKRRKTLVFEFPPCPRAGEDVVRIEGCTSATARASSTTARSLDPPQERWAVMGVNGAGKSTLLKLIAGRDRARRGHVTWAQRQARLLRPARHGAARPERTVYEIAGGIVSRWPTSAR